MWWSQNGGTNYWLEHITITDQSARGSVSAATKPHELLPGEKVPDVPLINQDGKTLHLADFKGKAVLLTFIYTRCPLPTFCPLISSEFAAIHNDLAQTPADLPEDASGQRQPRSQLRYRSGLAQVRTGLSEGRRLRLCTLGLRLHQSRRPAEAGVGLWS